MKQFLFSFLIALMIMPSLVCAMPVCADEKPAETTSAQPCAGHHNSSEEQQNNNKSDVNLLLDCMGVDLQTADTVTLNTPDLKISHIAFPFFNDVVSIQFTNVKTQAIRAPPERISLLEPKTPIFLTTQRFRI